MIELKPKLSRSDPTDVFLTIIRNDFPDMEIRSVQRIPVGLDHVVLQINSKFIFRFSVDRLSNIVREIAVLTLLKDAGVRRIPVVSFLGRSAAYFGYEKLEGITLSESDAGSIPKDKRRLLASQIASFLVRFHECLTISDARGVGIEEYNALQFGDIVPIINKNFGNDRNLVRFASNAVDEFFADDHEKFPKKVLHWDLHNGNLVLNAENYSLNGVIDFDGTIICDVHAEFRSLYRFNPELAAETVEAYNALTGEELTFRRVQLYAWLVRLFDLAEAARGRNGRVHKMAMDRIQAWISQGAIML